MTVNQTLVKEDNITLHMRRTRENELVFLFFEEHFCLTNPMDPRQPLIHMNDKRTVVTMHSHNVSIVDLVTRDLVDAAPFLIHNG